ncbi:MAG: hypothetical protein S0880_19325 [Actinomycetota bacterium]|nr:hypothetical protein [Actinomycetota bacterium]
MKMNEDADLRRDVDLRHEAGSSSGDHQGAVRARGDAGRGLYVPLGTIATILLIIVLLMIIF